MSVELIREAALQMRMDPLGSPTATATADLLDAVANEMDVESCGWSSLPYAWTAALNVARAYLGVTA